MTESCAADGELVEQVLDLQMSIVCWGAGGEGERENSLYGQYLQLDPERSCQLETVPAANCCEIIWVWF